MKSMLKDAPSMEGSNLVEQVACNSAYSWDENLENQPNKITNGPHVVVIDCGAKYQILRYLNSFGAKVTVVPFSTSKDDILRLAPDGIMISNGPGDPAAVTGLPETLRNLMGKLPMFGICLGHQLLCLAAGGSTYKLKFGHHGANHPVLNKNTGKIEITSQNHGFAADGESLEKNTQKNFGKLEVSHVHLSDGTIEGFSMPDINVTAIQYHPEASPGPHDASYLFKEFFTCLKN
jgi:carbamoyl-phosphate synthase small subunit